MSWAIILTGKGGNKIDAKYRKMALIISVHKPSYFNCKYYYNKYLPEFEFDMHVWLIHL